GKMDLLEIEMDDNPRYFPVEYKRGKPKVEEWDKVQLCAQAFCIEEMRQVSVTQGAIWYWEVRRREQVSIDGNLRALTMQTILAAHKLLEAGVTPKPEVPTIRCR